MFGLQAFICPFQMAGNGFLSAEDVTEKQKQSPCSYGESILLKEVETKYYVKWHCKCYKENKSMLRGQRLGGFGASHL
jgi:hypothetical protein